METMLVKDAGYTLRDIRGTRERVVRRTERTDFVARLRRFLPFCEDPSPKIEVEERNDRGMDEEEVVRRVIYHDEIERLREEEQEDRMREIQRKNSNTGL